VGDKAGAKKIGNALKTRGESLSEIPRATPTQSAKQTKQEKTMTGHRLGRMGTEEAGHKREKRVEENGVKHRTKGREH
jgi:hypothetical protein